MDFGLSDEQRLLQDTVEQFLAKENDATRLRARFDADDAVDRRLWRGMAELGLAGLVIPEAHGGAGLALLDAALVAETLGRAAAPGPFLGHTLASLALTLGVDAAVVGRGQLADDGLAEASNRLAQKRGTRRAVVIVMTDRFSEEDRQKALDAAARATPLVLVVQFTGEGAYAAALDSIVKWSGGRYEQIGSVSGVGKTLQKLAPELDAPWLVVYDTPSAAEARKVEVKVARKGTKVRVRPAGL